MRMLKYSNEATNSNETWPFFCVSIMFTKQAIVALRSSGLNKHCNKAKAIIPVLHDFHAACFRRFEK